MAGPLPEGFVERPGEFERLVKHLLDRAPDEQVALTAALRGAGGYGKTTLARALCHDARVRDAYPDGVLWVTLGEAPGELTKHLTPLIHELSPERPLFNKAEEAAHHLAKLLSDRKLLLVIDDVWNAAHLRPFLQGGPQCARLITTRDAATLPGSARTVPVDAMQVSEAVKMLGAGLGQLETAEIATALTALAKRLGEWPLLLNLVNGALRRRIELDGQALSNALRWVNQALDKRGLTFFDEKNAEERNQAVAKTLGVSLDLLSADERARFAELAIYPEDAEIPLPTLQKLWARTSGRPDFDDFDTEDLCSRLNRWSLLWSYAADAQPPHLRLHDVVRAFLITQHHDELVAIHNHLLEAHTPATPALNRPGGANWAALPESEPYLWEHLAFHLVAAGRGAELVATVKDWRYLATKTWLRKAAAVEADLQAAVKVVVTDDPLHVLLRGYANASHLLNRCEDQRSVELTLYFRLHHLTELKQVLVEMDAELQRPLLKPLNWLPDQPHPALVRTIEGHLHSVIACAFSPDSKVIVSASADGFIRVWEIATGKLLGTIDNQSVQSVLLTDCVFSPDGRFLVSAATDGTFSVWDSVNHKLLKMLRGHGSYILRCVFSSDSKLMASASEDRTLKIWDAHTLKVLRTLKGHHSSVASCAFSPDGKQLISASADQTLKLWDVMTGQCTYTFDGHSNAVTSCEFHPEGRAMISASQDQTVKIWDAVTGKLIRTLEGHSDCVFSCAFSPDGQLIASASWDGSLKVWEFQTGRLLRTLEGHSNWVNDCRFSPDGRFIASASEDQTVKIWECFAKEGLRKPDVHADEVFDCAFSGNGELVVSASWDETVKIWDVLSGAVLRTFEGHSFWVEGCAVSPDNNLIASASQDCTVKIWNIQTGAIVKTLEMHSKGVNDCAFSPDGRLIISASDDGALKIWDVQTGKPVRTLFREDWKWANSCIFSPDGNLILASFQDGWGRVFETSNGKLLCKFDGKAVAIKSSSFSSNGKLVVSAFTDGTLKIWEALTGKLLHTFVGHAGCVWDCSFASADQFIVSVSDDCTLKIWETASKECSATFYADESLYCCTIYRDEIVAGGTRGVYFLRLVR